MYLNGEKVQEKGYLAELMTQRACEFLDKQAAGTPFFLTVGYLNPHTPYSGHPQKYYDMYANTPFDTVGWEPAAPNALREKEMLNDTVGKSEALRRRNHSARRSDPGPHSEIAGTQALGQHAHCLHG